MERRELPQVSHVDRGSVSDQQLGHLVVTVRTGVMKGNQTTEGTATVTHTQTELSETVCKCLLLCLPQIKPQLKCHTLCPWRARRPRGAAGTPPLTLCCSQQQSEGVWSVVPPGLYNSHSEPYTMTGKRWSERQRGKINEYLSSN